MQTLFLLSLLIFGGLFLILPASIVVYLDDRDCRRSGRRVADGRRPVVMELGGFRRRRRHIEYPPASQADHQQGRTQLVPVSIATHVGYRKGGH